MAELTHAICFATDEPAGLDWASHPEARTVHFLRHGEAEHQRRAADAARNGLTCRCEEAERDGRRASACPYFAADLVDAPLTELGRRQCAGAGAACAAEIVLAAASMRSLQTVLAAFPPPRPPVLALEELRARVGPHMHSRRRPRGELRAAFPGIDFDGIRDDEDRLWSPDPEPRAALDARAARFLAHVFARPERTLAVIAHFTLFLALFLRPDEPTLLGLNPARAAGDPPLIDARGSQRAQELAGYVAIGSVRSLVLVPRVRWSAT